MNAQKAGRKRGLTDEARALVIGVICIIGSRYVSNLVWAIVLIILGFVAGNLGGSLLILGAILGLLSTLLKPTRR